ncbi:MAG TPA: glycosyltransferase family 2 protein [Pirellulales bacterium]|nr:glycosyltransferase family 2 protein [Pirellulales bacterium]
MGWLGGRLIPGRTPAEAACGELFKPFEIVFVNDGSTDATWSEICRLVAQSTSVVGVNLSRNFGQQAALVAGLSTVRGERVLIIDADLQDPPELLPTMLELMDDGADVVYGKRRSRRGESAWKRFTAAAFYRLLNMLAEVRIPDDTGDFRLISRRALEVFLSMPERPVFVRGMMSWMGFQQVAIEFDRDSRFSGVTKWPFTKMMRLGIDAVVSFSASPLRLGLLCGFLTFVIGCALATYAAVQWYANGPLSGTAVVAAVAFLLQAMHFSVLAVFAEYLARMHQQIQGRPSYVIESIERQRPTIGRPEGESCAFNAMIVKAGNDRT